MTSTTMNPAAARAVARVGIEHPQAASALTVALATFIANCGSVALKGSPASGICDEVLEVDPAAWAFGRWPGLPGTAVAHLEERGYLYLDGEVCISVRGDAVPLETAFEGMAWEPAEELCGYDWELSRHGVVGIVGDVATVHDCDGVRALTGRAVLRRLLRGFVHEPTNEAAEFVEDVVRFIRLGGEVVYGVFGILDVEVAERVVDPEDDGIALMDPSTWLFDPWPGVPPHLFPLLALRGYVCAGADGTCLREDGTAVPLSAAISDEEA